MYTYDSVLRRMFGAQPLEILKNGLSLSLKALLKGRFSTVGLTVLSSIDQLLFLSIILFTFLIPWATVLISPLQLVFPGMYYDHFMAIIAPAPQ